MLKKLKLLISRNWSAKRLTNNDDKSLQQKLNQLSHPLPPERVLRLDDTVQQVSVYVHRFHNLDLFHQGWYQIKITARWENDENALPGTPARVFQYEAPDLGSEDMFEGWRIDDTENSFLTQPFRIRYARQDVYLCIMISFDLPLCNTEDLYTSAVILKFELLYASVSTNGTELQPVLEACPDAIHEFRIPSKALTGLHSYCPVYFDALHAVLIDTTVHTVIKAGSTKPRVKIPSDGGLEDVSGNGAGPNQPVVTYRTSCQKASAYSKEVMLLKSLIASHDMLLKALQQMSHANGHTTELKDLTSNMASSESYTYSQHMNEGSADRFRKQLSAKIQNGEEIACGADMLQQISSFSHDELSGFVDLVGHQISYLWSIFLNLHRVNKTRILEYLYDSWADNRRAEWSIWMACSRVEFPLHCLRGALDESYLGAHERALDLQKLTGDPAQKAATRAELLRRSIAQMRINSRSIQDMQLFCDPLNIPVIFVEHVSNVPSLTTSEHAELSCLKHKYTPCSVSRNGFISSEKFRGAIRPKDGRILKIAVFVHGFQGHHLDLRLVRNQWLLIDPKVEILMSKANEDKTSGDFREMGLRLAEEVIGFVKKKMDKASRSGNLRDIKLNFVGHSIGNIIIRASLAESIMEPYLRYLHTFVSISGPHLGYLYSSNSLFNSGLWLLKKFKGSQCIHQLTLSDDSELENTFFYKLCEEKTLEGFKNVIVLSSPQDGYVPYHSARIQLCQAALADNSKKGKVFLEMLKNCLNQVLSPSSYPRVFMRCDVNFSIFSSGKNLTTYIGRAAHIEFLESDIYIRFIMWSFPELFG